MSNTKYVVGLYRDPSRRSGPEGKFFEEVVAVVFDSAISHDAMDAVFLGVHSAGFCSLSAETGQVSCFGRSESLDLDSVPAIDQYFVAKALRLPVSGPAPLSAEQLRAAILESRKARGRRW